MSNSPYMALGQQSHFNNQPSYGQPPYNQPPYEPDHMKYGAQQQPPYAPYGAQPAYGQAAPGPYTQAPPQYNSHQQFDQDQPMFENKATFDQAFKVARPKWNDLWAGILLIIVFVGYAGISGYALSGWHNFAGNGEFDKTDRFGVNKNTTGLFGVVVVVAFVFSFAYLVLARLFTKAFIYITGILQILLLIVAAAFFFYKKQWIGGIVWAVAALITMFAFYTWIPRIPFSVLMLETSVDVSRRHGHSYVVSIVGGVTATLFAAWYVMTLIAVFAQWLPGTTGSKSNENPVCSKTNACSLGKVIGFVIYTTFAMFWVSEWLKNTIHTTISGVYGSWYFMPNSPPKGATRGAFRRTMTYSFGSVALGSLIVAIINFIQWLVQSAQRAAAEDGNWGAWICLCFLNCFIGLLESVAEFINRYAFSHIALYGKPYIAAAKDTWKMIKNRGIDALINECLVGPVLTIGALFVGVVCALVSYGYLQGTNPGYIQNGGGGYVALCVIFSFLIGIQVSSIFTTPLSSGMDTIFVAMAWEPEVLMQQHPDLYQRMVAVYPQVQEKIHA